MGWTGVYMYEPYYENFRDGKGGFNRKEFLDAEFSGHNEVHKWEILKSSMVGSTYYAAIKRTNLLTEFSHVYGMVALTSCENNWFYYKDMSEDMGPCKYDCPENILSLLSETDIEYALEWRKQCREARLNKAYKAKIISLAKKNNRWVKYTLPRTFNSEYKKGDEVWLHWRALAWEHGKTKYGWTDGAYRWPRTMINWDCCEIYESDAKTKVALPPKKVLA